MHICFCLLYTTSYLHFIKQDFFYILVHHKNICLNFTCPVYVQLCKYVDYGIYLQTIIFDTSWLSPTIVLDLNTTKKKEFYSNRLQYSILRVIMFRSLIKICFSLVTRKFTLFSYHWCQTCKSYIFFILLYMQIPWQKHRYVVFSEPYHLFLNC